MQVSHSPRDGHLGVLAGALALWKQRASGHESHVEFTGGEMAYLLRAGRRQTQRSGGGDVDWVYNLLADLATERITAQVAGDEASQAHKIPCSAIVNVERRLDGQWLTLTEYEAALAQGSQLFCLGLAVVVVEDEPVLLMLLEDMLDDLGYSVVGAAGSVSEASKLASSTECDVAILDVNLDGSGPAEKTGLLVVENFAILGDPVWNDKDGHH